MMNVRRIGLALVFAACAPAADRAEEGGSTVTVLLPGDESTIWSDAPQFLLFVPLVARNEKGEVEGRLARSWEHSPDYRSWTIHLRTDVRWHDGADPEVEDGAYREISGLVRADQPVAFLFRAADAHVVHRRVRGLVDSRQANPPLFADELWLE